ncbi:NADH dehydrogenase subunit 5 [Heyndrickxia camelliae]|uniref:Probable inorganic carbon transporter subunit DabB n=1 Tax=Heyndrickxia camelliae TaxID=1707093 RepID=A0A2N3LK57_9BACI|nr:NADH dehydrogenase subunit 5 [Heyndrickxia camelliae]PKR84929.1 NADH-quinone oxidoreductase subunit L [Heyndrickxia camelliae]
MLFSLNLSSLLIIFFSVLSISVLSGLLFLHRRVPLRYVRIHIGVVALPPLVALIALINTNARGEVGAWYLDSISWLLAFFVLLLGLIIQRFSLRYLMGDLSYRKYFILFTFTTGAASLAWLSDDLRLMAICWGFTLVGLISLIRLNRGWKVAREAATVSGRLFALSWIAIVLAIIWLSHDTGQWQLSSALKDVSLAHLETWEKTGINLLLILGVMIPAAQWPFQRWLLESVVAPTPVSAIMHAGLVNAGGVILTRFSPIFDGNIAQIILLILASISVFIGTGISLVQVDYKRQLVGSTIAQMGFMLIQCALGAYSAAIFHLVFHGLFKATLFLQAGSLAPCLEKSTHGHKNTSYSWLVVGNILAVLVGIAFWLQDMANGYQLISALIIGWSLSFSWKQLVAFGEGRIDRIAGLLFMGLFTVLYLIIHNYLYGWLPVNVYQSNQLSMAVIIFIVCLLLLSSIIGKWIVQRRSSVFFTVIYLWLVRLGEAQPKAVESHPNYLKFLSQGGNK